MAHNYKIIPMGKRDQLCDTYSILRILQREHSGKKCTAYIYLLLGFKSHIFCAPGNPIHIVEHSHKAQEI